MDGMGMGALHGDGRRQAAMPPTAASLNHLALSASEAGANAVANAVAEPFPDCKMPNLPQPGSIRTSASMPHVARRPKPDAIAAVARRAHPLPSKHFLPKLGTPNSPHGVGQPAQKKARAEAAQPPAALRDIQNFLDGELKNLDARHGAPEVRLQAHRQAFDLFIGHFGTYAGPLSAIKHEYESYTLLLQKRIDASAKRQADAHAVHERSARRNPGTRHRL